VSLREVRKIGVALGAAIAVLLVARALAPLVVPVWGYATYAAIPIGVSVIDFAIAFLGTAGVRGVRRVLSERSTRTGLAPSHRASARRTILIGAGEAGAMVAREIAHRPDLGIEPTV
jgi:FlaA1/EpsC-like NDP-sugar epimerase